MREMVTYCLECGEWSDPYPVVEEFSVGRDPRQLTEFEDDHFARHNTNGWLRIEMVERDEEKELRETTLAGFAVGQSVVFSEDAARPEGTSADEAFTIASFALMGAQGAVARLEPGGHTAYLDHLAPAAEIVV